MTHALANELEIARQLALAAGALVLRYHGGELTVEHKHEGEPVTIADREANELIVAGLARAFPRDAILAEETPDDRARLGRERVWMVDPIDGTREFIRGRDGFSVMIGLCVDGRPALGVVYQPRNGRMYFASRGQGAWLAEGQAAPRSLRVSAIAELPKIRLVASQSHRTLLIDQVRQALGITDELNVGSVGLKLGLIACAERDLYLNPSTKSSAWDTAGPEAILAEAGGRLTDLHGRLLVYDREEVRNLDGLVASNGVVHEVVLERIRPLFPERQP